LTREVVDRIEVSDWAARRVDDLFGAYTTVVDGREWHEWPKLFASDGSYAVYSLENVERGLPLAYALDDNHDRLVDRVKFITEVWAGTVEPYRTRHIVQRTRLEPIDEDLYSVRSNVVVSYTELDGPPGMLASGYYEDRVRIADGVARFVERTVYLDGMPARYLVYPL
jgi:3-phenylpropionate/cinnamic acid dioxygenase small subunit